MGLLPMWVCEENLKVWRKAHSHYLKIEGILCYALVDARELTSEIRNDITIRLAIRCNHNTQKMGKGADSTNQSQV
jgi:carbamoylphosphate synthase small subunit